MNIAKKLLDRAGLEVKLKKNVQAYARRNWEQKWADAYRFLGNEKIQTVLDIGANHGQFAKMIRHACPTIAELHSFEPLAECQDELKRALGEYKQHFVHPFGLADKAGTAEINHSEFSPTSSLLEPNERLTRDHPDAGKIKKETIELRTLDDWAEDSVLLDPMLIKIDVQGTEDRVILGGEKTIARARYVIIEMPFYSLYKGQPTFHDIYMMLHERGFIFRGNAGQNISKTDFRILEADAIFENTGI